MSILILTNTLILVLISLLHVYWAYGGKWGADAAHPTTRDGEYVINPGKRATLIVAFGLAVFALITLGNFGWFDGVINRKYIDSGTWLITVIFLLRAVGEFNYVGFFKKTTQTVFARNDTKFYSPLCVLIGMISLMIAILN